MEELNRIIAKNISDLRRDASMTQAELGERLCYSDKLVSKWERGEAAPNVFTLKQMSEIFGVGVEYFFSEHDGNEVIVVDFKFGTPLSEHHDQVRRYMSLLSEMGYTNIKGYLWYVYSNLINEVK